MTPKRLDQENSTSTTELTNQAETLRAATASPFPAPPASESKKEEEKISLFWRLFGGSVLSIAGLVIINVLQNISSSVAELRNQVQRVNEARAELIKKEEHEANSQRIWARIQELQNLNLAIHSLRDQLNNLSERELNASKEFKEKQDSQSATLAQLREKLTQLEQTLKIVEEDRKAIQTLSAAMTAMQEKSANRDIQVKGIEASIASTNEKLTTATKDGKDRDDQIKMQIAALKDRVATTEQIAKMVDENQKTIQKLSVDLSSLQERLSNREAAAKKAEEEKKELQKELQTLRERLAKVEGQTEHKREGKNGGANTQPTTSNRIPFFPED